MKKSILILTSLLLLAGCKPPVKNMGSFSVPVSVHVLKPETISSYIKLTGGIEAEEDAVVYSKIGEKLVLIRVKLGDHVQVGQVLAEQYNEGLKESVNQAEASLRNALAQYEMAKTDFERMERLIATKAISPQQFKTSYEAAESGLDQAKAALQLAKESCENSLIKAPFSGKVAMIYYDPNQMVPAGQPVFRIVNAKNVKAKLDVPEVDIAHITPGLKVKANFPAYPDTTFSGFVDRVDEAIDPDTRTLEIEVRIDNKSGLLKSGQFGQFLVETDRHEQAIVVTDAAIMTQTNVEVNDLGNQTEIKKYYTYIVRDGATQKHFVTPGIISQGRMELVDGVSIGDSLIVTGQNVVKDGNPVRVVNK
jgi:membrane fusion protein (multidrug efflux system)